MSTDNTSLPKRSRSMFKFNPNGEATKVTFEENDHTDLMLELINECEEDHDEVLEQLTWGCHLQKSEIAALVVCEAIKLAMRERKEDHLKRRAKIHKRRQDKRNKKDMRDYIIIDLTK